MRLQSERIGSAAQRAKGLGLNSPATRRQDDALVARASATVPAATSAPTASRAADAAALPGPRLDAVERLDAQQVEALPHHHRRRLAQQQPRVLLRAAHHLALGVELVEDACSRKGNERA